MSKRKRTQRAASGEPRQPMNQPQGNSHHHRRPSHHRRQAPATTLTERERALLDLYKIQHDSEKQITEMYTAASEELNAAKRFLSVLGLLPMYESFVNPSTAADEIEYCKEAVSDIVTKIAASR